MGRVRGFEVVEQFARKHFEEVKIAGKMQRFDLDITLPTRDDAGSAGYDFYAPNDVTVLPTKKLIFWTDVKAYMQKDEVLKVYPRSGMGVKNGLMLADTVGVIDSSHYNNPSNDGNIGIALLNTSGKAIIIKAGDRFAQGVFQPYLTTDDDNAPDKVRGAGFGSSGK